MPPATPITQILRKTRLRTKEALQKPVPKTKKEASIKDDLSQIKIEENAIIPPIPEQILANTSHPFFLLDPILATIAAKSIKPCPIIDIKKEITSKTKDEINITAFRTLCKTIIYQQLADKAASAIHKRFLEAFEGLPLPALVVAKPIPDLRAVGLSERKVGYIQSLAQHFVDKTLDPSQFPTATDAEVIAALTQVSGIGEWSAHMYLMFELHRPDVFPCGDLAVRKSIATHFKDEPEVQGEIGVLARKGKGGKRVEEALTRLCERKWKPYRSVGSWYMWQYPALVKLES